MGNCVKKSIHVLQEVDKVVSGKQQQGHQQHQQHQQQQHHQNEQENQTAGGAVPIADTAISTSHGGGVGGGGGGNVLYKNAFDIPSSHFDNHRSLRCRVITVSDGDSLRVQHIGEDSSVDVPVSKSRKLKDWTIAIRVYAVDCPETAKFGKPGMAFGQEAKEYASNSLQKNDIVEIKLLARDQYARVVGVVQFKDRSRNDEWTDLSVGLISNGLAEVYRGGGGEYDGKRDLFETLESQAKASRKGQWSIPEDKRMTAAEYKRKYK